MRDGALPMEDVILQCNMRVVTTTDAAKTQTIDVNDKEGPFSIESLDGSARNALTQTTYPAAKNPP